MRRPFPIRFSDEEMATLRLRAQARGWSVGRYVRWRVLGEDLGQDGRIKRLEQQVAGLSRREAE